MPIIAAVIVSVGALLGIFLGAAFAADRISAQLEENRVLFEAQLEENRQLQRKQLDSESERLQMQLDAAERRLDQQLRADRAKQDRAELRETLDDGAELLARANNHLSDASRQVEAAAEFDWSKNAADAAEPLPALSDFVETMESLAAYWQRLLIRFDHEDPIPRTVRVAIRVYRVAMETIGVPRNQIDDQLLASYEEKWQEFNSPYVDFLTECRKRFGVVDD